MGVIFKKNKRGQIWVETVIYTLIAFAIIALVLSFVKPKIGEVQDKTIIDQSLGMIKDIDAIILEVTRGGVGNKRKIELGIKKGILRIEPKEKRIVFEMDSDYIYSEPGQDVHYGDTVVRTESRGEINRITLTNTYEEYGLQYNGDENTKSLNKASTPYQMYISNEGNGVINIEVN